MGHIYKLTTFFCLIGSLFANDNGVIKINEEMEIYHETFGKKGDSTCLLIMGAGAPGMFWSTEFCEKLVQKGFYVIRYDQRDTGSSTCFDFEKNPYTLLDLAKDALGLLDALQIKEAHLVGLSMGGPVAELAAIHDPTRIQSIALIATSPEFRPLILSMLEMPSEAGSLSSPKPDYIQAAKELLITPSFTREEMISQQLIMWGHLNGKVLPFNQEGAKELQNQFFSKIKNPDVLANHMFAIRASESLIREAPQQVKIPTAIFLGLEDPIFGPDHGIALSRAIKGSKYYPVEGMGHLLHDSLIDFFVERIAQNAQDALDNREN